MSNFMVFDILFCFKNRSVKKWKSEKSENFLDPCIKIDWCQPLSMALLDHEKVKIFHFRGSLKNFIFFSEKIPKKKTLFSPSVPREQG